MEWLISACVLVIAGCAFWFRHSTRKERVIQSELDAIVEAEQNKPVEEASALSGADGEAPTKQEPVVGAVLNSEQRRFLTLILNRCRGYRQPVLLHHRSGWRFQVTPVGNGFVIIRDKKGSQDDPRAKMRRFVCTQQAILFVDESRETCKIDNDCQAGMQELNPEAYEILWANLNSTYRTA